MMARIGARRGIRVQATPIFRQHCECAFSLRETATWIAETGSRTKWLFRWLPSRERIRRRRRRARGAASEGKTSSINSQTPGDGMRFNVCDCALDRVWFGEFDAVFRELDEFRTAGGGPPGFGAGS